MAKSSSKKQKEAIDRQQELEKAGTFSRKYPEHGFYDLPEFEPPVQNASSSSKKKRWMKELNSVKQRVARFREEAEQGIKICAFVPFSK